MDVYVLILRLLHVGGGVFWVGAALFMVYYVSPTATALGSEGERFVGRLVQSGAAVAISVSSLLVSLSGVLLYWRVSAGLNAAWIASPAGLALTVGGLAGLASFVIVP